MAVEVLVPPLGQTVETLTLVSWYKQEGETVAQGEPLFSVETDKATLDVEAPASGVLSAVTAKPGDVVKVLSAIAVIGAEPKERPGDAGPHRGLDEGRTLRQSEGAHKRDAGVHALARPEPGATSAPRRFVSPRARRLAESEGIDLAEIAPTGPEGAIIERDVRAYVDAARVRAEQAAPSASISPVARRMAEEAGLDWQALAGGGPRGQITREDVEAALERRSRGTKEPPAPSAQPSASDLRPSTPAQQPASELPFAGIRALIAERMTAGHSNTAPVTLTTEADVTALVELRQKLGVDGIAASYNDLFLAILARALAEHPRINASLDGDSVKLWSQIDIALAVDTERGLLAPVVRGVDRKGLVQLAVETASLAERARNGKCAPDELTGGTFTLTNLGMYGIDAFTPIINLPECAILGVGRIRTQPIWVSDHVEPRQVVWLSLTFDHRLVDGGPAARFLQRVAQLAGKPHLLMA